MPSEMHERVLVSVLEAEDVHTTLWLLTTALMAKGNNHNSSTIAAIMVYCCATRRYASSEKARQLAACEYEQAWKSIARCPVYGYSARFSIIPNLREECSSRGSHLRRIAR